MINCIEYTKFLKSLFDIYLSKKTNVSVYYLDCIIKNLFFKTSGLCLHSKCINKYIAISNNGDLYPCNRFVGIQKYCYGNVKNITSSEDILNSDGYKNISKWFDEINEQCSGCLYYRICYGGCPFQRYNYENDCSKDRFCESYKSIYKHITDLSINQIFEDNNMSFLQKVKTDTGAFRLFHEGSIYEKLCM